MRLMKLLRVMRFFRSETSGVLKKIVASVGLPPGSMRAIRLILFTLVVAHTVACSWFFRLYHAVYWLQFKLAARPIDCQDPCKTGPFWVRVKGCR